MDLKDDFTRRVFILLMMFLISALVGLGTLIWLMIRFESVLQGPSKMYDTIWASTCGIGGYVCQSLMV